MVTRSRAAACSSLPVRRTFWIACATENMAATFLPNQGSDDSSGGMRWRDLHGRPGVAPRPCRSQRLRLTGLLHRLPAAVAGLRRCMAALRALVLVCHSGIPPRSKCEGLCVFPTSTKQEGCRGLCERKPSACRALREYAVFFYRVGATGAGRCYLCGRSDGRAASCHTTCVRVLIRGQSLRRGAPAPGAGPATGRRYSPPRRRPPRGERRGRPPRRSLPSALRSL